MSGNNILKFGNLIDDGDSGDGKRTYLKDDKDDNWMRISVEIDTDDCDTDHAKSFKKAFMELWNNQ